MPQGFVARRAPNVSQYLANLNTVPTQPELATGQQRELALGDDDLDFLTNAEFFDFDQFGPNAAAFDHRHHHQQPHHPQAAHQFQPGQTGSGLFPYQSLPSHHTVAQSQPPLPPPTTGVTSPTSSMESQSPNQPLQGIYPPQPSHFLPAPGTTATAGGSGSTGAGGATADDQRRDSLAMHPVADLEDASRVAAEEDKRRRNTAASARFRVKKKQREQALEKQAKEMTDKVQQLEGKVQQLEMENKWLKELITEKSETKPLENGSENASKKTDERKAGNHTDGVGTHMDRD